MRKGFISSIVRLALLPFLLKLASTQNTGNGTRGDPWLWECQRSSSKPFQPNRSNIYWQGLNNSQLVLHMYKKGKEDLKFQSDSFKNRTTIFVDQLPSGNFSLLIEPLLLTDDQISVEVVFTSGTPEKMCQTTLHVSAAFQKPELKIDQEEMKATCTTKGGYPRPEITWTSWDGLRNRSLDQQQVNTSITSDNDGTYQVVSVANVTGSRSVTCSVYNPTSKKNASTTTDTGHHHTIIIILVLLGIGIGTGIGIGIWCWKKKPWRQWRQQRRGGDRAETGQGTELQTLKTNGEVEK